MRFDSAIWRAKLLQPSTVRSQGRRFWRLRCRRGIFGGVVLAVFSASFFGPLGGCKSEKAAPRPSEVHKPAPTLEGGKTKVGGILVNSVTQDWGTPHINNSVDGKPLLVGGHEYQTGFGTHATSRIEISFLAKSKTFTGSCGVDDEVENRGSVVFKVLDGEKVLFESPLMKGGMKAADFSVPVNALTSLTLIVENGGDNIDSDHADWVNLNLK